MANPGKSTAPVVSGQATRPAQPPGAAAAGISAASERVKVESADVHGAAAVASRVAVVGPFAPSFRAMDANESRDRMQQCWDKGEKLFNQLVSGHASEHAVGGTRMLD
jgi:hypothetical protein